METADSGATSKFGQIGSVTVDLEDHITGDVTDDSIGMGCTIVKEIGAGVGCALGALRLGCSESAKGH